MFGTRVDWAWPLTQNLRPLLNWQQDAPLLALLDFSYAFCHSHLLLYWILSYLRVGRIATSPQVDIDFDVLFLISELRLRQDTHTVLGLSVGDLRVMMGDRIGCIAWVELCVYMLLERDQLRRCLDIRLYRVLSSILTPSPKHRCVDRS